MLDLEPIKAREKKATPGPWKCWPVDPAIPDDIRICQSVNSECICCVALMGDVDEQKHWTAETVERWKGDGDFIAHVREDVRLLILEVEQLRKELAKGNEAQAEAAAR